MRINDLLQESNDKTTKEWIGSPTGGIGSLATKAMAKLGSGTAQAAVDVNKRTDEIYKAFSDWALRSGVNMQAVSMKALNNWFKNQQLPELKNPPYNNPTLTLDLSKNSKVGLENVKKVFKAVAQQAFGSSMQGGAAPGTASLGSQYGTAQAAGGGAAGNANTFNQIQNMLGSLSPKQINQLKQLLNRI